MWYWKEKEIAQGLTFMIRLIINNIIIAINVKIVVFDENKSESSFVSLFLLLKLRILQDEYWLPLRKVIYKYS
jgi:hypothetical protein